MWRARSSVMKGSKAIKSHAEGRRSLRDERADLAETDDTERLAVEFDALPLAALPLARLQRRVGLGDVARLRQQQRHGLLGRREDVATPAR